MKDERRSSIRIATMASASAAAASSPVDISSTSTSILRMTDQRPDRLSSVSTADADAANSVVGVTVTPDMVHSDQKKLSPTKVFSSSVKTEDDSSTTQSRKTKRMAVMTQVRPTVEECYYVTQKLGELHPHVLQRNRERQRETTTTTTTLQKSATESRNDEACASKPSVLDGVVSTILSQNTTNANSSRAFAQLKQTFPHWDLVASLPNPLALEETIRSAGLAKIKSERIYAMLQTIRREGRDRKDTDDSGGEDTVSLEYLRNCSDEDIKKDLSRFKGMGPKTISCVMLFTMQRPEFPVDTHVHRIGQQMGWIGPSMNREDAYEHLNAMVPKELKLDLHCLLIEHGKQCHRCAARGKPQFPPKDGSRLKCPLTVIGSHYKKRIMGGGVEGDAVVVVAKTVMMTKMEHVKVKTEP